jgi:lysophospholipase L1-like esterase
MKGRFAMPARGSFFIQCFSAVFFIILSGCDSMESKVSMERAPAKSIPAECTRALNGHRILFAHMSVGYDIMAGLALAAGPSQEKIAIQEIDAGSPADSRSSGISHIKIGANAQPLRKLAGFRQYLLSNNNGQAFDLVGIKLCYVDIKQATDIHAVLQEYAALVKDVTARYPHIKFVHFTVPLTTHSRDLKSRIKHLILGDQDNIRRNAYNEILSETYKNQAVIDIARLESTFSDGSRMEHSFFQTRHYSLIPAYTTDGGHLNDTGKRIVAAPFAEGLCKALSN